MTKKKMSDDPIISLACSSNELLVMCGGLLESEELLYGECPDFWKTTILMTREECDGLHFLIKNISESKKESDYPTDVSLPYWKWCGLLRAVRLVSDRRNDVWDELDSRTGCAVDEFDAFAERLSAVLMSIETPATTVEKST